MSQWLTADPLELALVALGTVLAYAALIVLTRASGLRSFAKTSSTDFVVTLAIGSVFAAVIASKKPPLLQGLVALGSLFLLKVITARLRRRVDTVRRLIDNQPVLVMRDGRFIEDNLEQTEVSRLEVIAKLREANVLDYSEVQAVVVESTGDVSVLHADPSRRRLDTALLEGVQLERAQA